MKYFGGQIVLTEGWARGVLNQCVVLREKAQPVRSSQASSFYLRRELDSKEAFRLLFKNIPWLIGTAWAVL